MLQIRLGQTDGTDGNAYTVSSVKVEKAGNIDLISDTIYNF